MVYAKYPSRNAMSLVHKCVIMLVWQEKKKRYYLYKFVLMILKIL